VRDRRRTARNPTGCEGVLKLYALSRVERIKGSAILIGPAEAVDFICSVGKVRVKKDFK